MYCVKKWLPACLLVTLFNTTGCQGVTDDLTPSDSDKRPTVVSGSTGSQPTQSAPDFTAVDTLNNSRTLSSELALADSVVLYFTMWCPICDSHMAHIRSQLIPEFPNVRFLVIDYVTGSVPASRAAQLANGYASFTVLADSNQALHDTFKGSMGITVVIDGAGIVRMNEYYKDGRKLRETLAALP
ncbi:hypothetical protein MNBD_GAMMA19-1267 [hydrothermal vent metagenome]|uniref:Thioredoxin domain-containing protein n=1 Tax=hydrothermal vent metagenome TaxID=652676 RepID=A0A3B1ATL4_9ZZZZ